MTTTTRLSDTGRNGQNAPHNPTTDDPFALIPGAYGYDWEQDTAPTTKPAVQTPPPAAPVQVVTRTRVVDCPSYAWDESGQDARRELGGFYDLYSALLDEAAHELIRPLLIAEWRKAGRLARLVPQGTFTSVPDSAEEFVPDEQRWAVWQAAANQVSGAELVFAAGLVDEFVAFSDRDF